VREKFLLLLYDSELFPHFFKSIEDPVELFFSVGCHKTGSEDFLPWWNSRTDDGVHENPMVKKEPAHLIGFYVVPDEYGNDGCLAGPRVKPQGLVPV
jgi:hypothetical protein